MKPILLKDLIKEIKPTLSNTNFGGKPTHGFESTPEPTESGRLTHSPLEYKNIGGRTIKGMYIAPTSPRAPNSDTVSSQVRGDNLPKRNTTIQSTPTHQALNLSSLRTDREAARLAGLPRPSETLPKYIAPMAKPKKPKKPTFLHITPPGRDEDFSAEWRDKPHHKKDNSQYRITRKRISGPQKNRFPDFESWLAAREKWSNDKEAEWKARNRVKESIGWIKEIKGEHTFDDKGNLIGPDGKRIYGRDMTLSQIHAYNAEQKRRNELPYNSEEIFGKPPEPPKKESISW